MEIDITEIMKTGLFELRYEKIDGFEEWVITPIKKDNDYTDGWVNWEFTDNLKDFSTWDKNIPWHEIPERFNWVAQDRNGEWFAHEDRPIIEDGEWVSSGYVCYIEYPLSDSMPILPDFTESLIRRPDYEQKAT